MMYDSSPPSIRAKTQTSPVIKKASAVSMAVEAFLRVDKPFVLLAYE